MPTHTVTQGECLTSIADRYGFYWQTLWNDPANEHLQRLGRHPNNLLPGDLVNIPERRTRSYTRQTGARYTWKVKGIPAKLRLELLWDEEPRANEPFTLTVEGAVIEGTTDGAGRLEVTIPPGAMSGRLKVGEGEREMEYSIALGHLDPATSITGVQGRLSNMGFACEVTGVLDDATRRALESFQTMHRLAVTGEIDEATSATLRAVHDAT